MAVLVPVLQALLVDVRMGVNVVAVAVLVFVGDMLLVVLGVSVFVHDSAPMLVAVATRVVMLVWLIHLCSLSRSRGRRRCAARDLC